MCGRGGAGGAQRDTVALLFARILISMSGLIGSSAARRANKVTLITCHDDIKSKRNANNVGGVDLDRCALIMTPPLEDKSMSNTQWAKL